MSAATPSAKLSEICFPAADGQATIEGILHQPAETGPLTPALIVAHGRYNDMSLPLLRDLCARAAEAGVRALRFNFRYVTLQAAPSPKGSAEVADLDGALDYLRREFQTSPAHIYLAGKSLGAIVASHVAARHPGMGGLIVLGYPLHGPGDSKARNVAHLARLGCPALFVIGDRDPFCRLDLLQPVLDTIPTSLTLEVIEGGDHSYRPPGAPENDAAYLTRAVDVVIPWLKAQIGTKGGECSDAFIMGRPEALTP